MTYYAQANEQGYVVGVTEEELLVGLFGGKAKVIEEQTAIAVRESLKAGNPVRLDDLIDIRTETLRLN